MNFEKEMIRLLRNHGALFTIQEFDKAIDIVRKTLCIITGQERHDLVASILINADIELRRCRRMLEGQNANS